MTNAPTAPNQRRMRSFLEAALMQVRVSPPENTNTDRIEVSCQSIAIYVVLSGPRHRAGLRKVPVHVRPVPVWSGGATAARTPFRERRRPLLLPPLE